VKYDILTFVNSKITAFQDVKQCSLICTNISEEPAGSNIMVLVDATCSSETLVLIYPTTQHHIPEHCVTTIKSESRVTFFIFFYFWHIKC
jgi:hypothetical protein